MEWYEILVLSLGIFIILSILLVTIRKIRYKYIVESVKNIVLNKYPDKFVKTYTHKHIYQVEFSTEKHYLIKIIDMNPNHEIIITNSEKVVINDDIRGWKRSSKPNFVSGIKNFIKIKADFEIIKIVLIYPNCHNITKYINECDAYKVENQQNVDGIFYIKYNELEKFLKNH